MAKNGTAAKAAAPATAAAKPATEKIRKPFAQLLGVRIDRAEKLVKILGKSFKRMGKSTSELAAALTSINTARQLVADLPADYKAPRPVITVQPMAVGTVVEIVASRRADFIPLLGDAAVAGTFTVTFAEAHKVVIKSTVDGQKAQLARRDVQLPGQPRAEKTDAERAEAKAKRLAKKAAKAASPVAPAAQA